MELKGFSILSFLLFTIINYILTFLYLRMYESKPRQLNYFTYFSGFYLFLVYGNTDCNCCYNIFS